MSYSDFLSDYSGTLQDKAMQLLAANGVTEGALADRWMVFLAAQGATEGTLPDRFRQFLLSYLAVADEGQSINDLWNAVDGPFSGSASDLDQYFSGTPWLYYDISQTDTLFQDLAGTVPVTAPGQKVMRVNDLSGYGYNALQSVVGKAFTYDIDADGYPRLLSVSTDGIDGLVAAGVDFDGVDDIFLCAAIAKASNTVSAVVAEFSTNADTTPGSFSLLAPSSSGTNKYAFRGTGATSVLVVTTSTVYNAPRIDVISGVADIATNETFMRVNGVEVASSGSSLGSGFFTNNTLYIGSRADGGTLPFTGGAIYALAIGKRQSLADMQAVEAIMATKIRPPVQLVTNGTFAAGTTGWTAGNSATLADDAGELVVTYNGGANPFAYQTITTVIGDLYNFTVQVTEATPSTILRVGTSAGNGANYSSTTAAGVRTITTTFTATATTSYVSLLAVTSTPGDFAKFDNVSVTRV